MSDRVFLMGEKVVLRGLEKSDLSGNYLRWFDDEEVCRHNSHHVFPYSFEEMELFISSLSGKRDNLVLAMVAKAENVHIGNIALQRIDHLSQTAEFAIVLGEKAFWGKGYAKEAGGLIIQHGFKALNLRRIYCGTNADNSGMIKLAKFLDFKEEGLRRQALYKNGQFVDVIEFGLLRDEWFSPAKR